MSAEGGTIDALLAGAPPDADAIVSPVHPALTYRELRRRVAAIGAVLRDQGIGAQDRVAVVADDARQLAVSFLGIASHAICAPLNPAMTASEAESVVAADLAPGALVLAAGAPFHDLPVPIVQWDIDALVGGDGTSSAQTPHVALLLTTSGTTARPKLVPLTHANVCASATNVARHLQLRTDDRALTVMPLFHIHGLVAGLVAPLAAGGTVACLPSMDPTKVLGWMSALGPTWYTAAPTVHQVILDQVTRHGSSQPTASLRFVRSSSAPMARRVITDLEAALGVPVIEAYGMTEAAHQITSNPLPPHPRKPGTVGVAAGPEVAVVDGEVVITGTNVTRGYLDNPEANDAAFRDGWFHTGDEGWLDDDGYLTITGRRSEVINRGGEKIAPREVDEALMDHPAIAQAAAFAMPHSTLGEEVAAAVTLHDSADVAPRALRAFAEKHLSPAKVPRRILVLDTLPKGPSGKLSRRVLAESLLSGRKSSRAPSTGLEAAVHGIFVMLLGGEEVGIDDDFFLMGGDSLRALELLDIVSDVFGVEISTEELVGEQVSVAALAVTIERGRQDRPRQRLFRFQSGIGRVPVVVVDPSLLLMRHLVPRLGTNRPVVGLAMAPHENDAHRSIETLAGAHLEILQAELPRGPYVLCGHSFAGLVAFEMAQQATQSGHEIALLALFDTIAPDRRWLTARLPARVHLRKARRLGWRRGTRYLRGISGERFGQRENGLRSGLDRELMSAVYRPRPYRGRMALLVTDANAAVARDPLLGWGEQARQPIDVVTVPGDHSTMLQEPLVTAMADAAAAVIDHADP